MYANVHNKGARQYADVHNVGNLGEETPHRLIQMLMDGLLVRINSAKGAIEHNDMEAKAGYISKAIGIVGGLNEALDLEKGGELAVNLRNLYDYMNLCLFQASQENSTDKLNEVASLMKEIKEAWDAIG